MDSRSGMTAGAGAGTRAGSSPLQSIYDEMCALNARLLMVAQGAEKSADALSGPVPTEGSNGAASPPATSRIGQFQEVVMYMRSNVNLIETHLGRITDTL